jgi:uncharacterized protein YbbC (DUF1343 family)
MSEKIAKLQRIPIRTFSLLIRSLILVILCTACPAKDGAVKSMESIIPGAWNTEEYLPLVVGKEIGIVANPTSMIGETHLIDSLLQLSSDRMRILKVFSPEHGFRGRAEYGETVQDGLDTRTGLPVVSLYGSNRKPLAEELDRLDIILFDIQDVGVRFYTYISTLYYMMQACAENGKELIVLDRPNPNGFYVDGPVLDTAFSSFIGLHPVPVVYGMTIGEYAMMINGEGWLGEGLMCNLKVISCQNYDHNSLYDLPVKPSPNLISMNSIYLYPSTCLFEGTVLSEGRGTDYPFEVFGHPELSGADFLFTPVSRPGIATHPKLEGQTCRGVDLRYFREKPAREKTFNLSWLFFAWNNFPDRDNFFIPYFDMLAGSDQLRKQIMSGMDKEEVRASWVSELDDFKEIRRKYLLYTDFE